MSGQVIEIWDSARDGLPRTFDAAREKLVALRTQETLMPSTAAMLTFAQQYQEYLQTHQEEIDDELFIDNGGLSVVDNVKQNHQACLVLDLPDESWERVLRAAVELAGSLGLVVHYNELSMFFLPKNRILPASRKELWEGLCDYLDNEQDDEDFPQTLKGFKKWFEPMVALMLSRYGFEKKGIHPDYPEWKLYTRKTSSLVQYISVDFRRLYNGFDPIVSVDMACEPVSQIYGLFKFYKTKTVFGGLLFSVVKSVNNDQYHIKSEQDAIRLINLIEEKMMPVFEVAQGIEGLDKVMHSDLFPFIKSYSRRSVHVPHALIIARLANNPEFEQLAIDLKACAPYAGVNNGPIREGEWDKLAKYLREVIKP